MKIAMIVLLCGFCFLSACAPSESAVQTAIARTQAAIPTITPLPTNTVTLTATPTITPSPTINETTTIMPTFSAEEINSAWNTIENTISSLIMMVPNVKTVQSVEASPDGTIQIRFENIRMIKDYLPSTQYEMIQMLSAFCTNTMAEQVKAYTGIENPTIKISSQSADNVHIYNSQTDFQTCILIGQKSISYDDWLKINQGEFSFRETATPSPTP